jgi:transcriptional regulator with XRE-family HTH domain
MPRFARKLEDPALVDALRDALDAGALGLADACRYMRACEGLTQSQFAKRVGVSIKVIKEIEAATGNPTLASLKRVASSMGLDVAFVRPRSTVKVGREVSSVARQAKARQAELRAVKQGKITLEQRHRTNALRGRDFTIELPKLS